MNNLSLNASKNPLNDVKSHKFLNLSNINTSPSKIDITIFNHSPKKMEELENELKILRDLRTNLTKNQQDLAESFKQYETTHSHELEANKATTRESSRSRETAQRKTLKSGTLNISTTSQTTAQLRNSSKFKHVPSKYMNLVDEKKNNHTSSTSSMRTISKWTKSSTMKTNAPLQEPNSAKLSTGSNKSDLQKITARYNPDKELNLSINSSVKTIDTTKGKFVNDKDALAYVNNLINSFRSSNNLKSNDGTPRALDQSAK